MNFLIKILIIQFKNGANFFFQFKCCYHSIIIIKIISTQSNTIKAYSGVLPDEDLNLNFSLFKISIISTILVFSLNVNACVRISPLKRQIDHMTVCICSFALLRFDYCNSKKKNLTYCNG